MPWPLFASQPAQKQAVDWVWSPPFCGVCLALRTRDWRPETRGSTAVWLGREGVRGRVKCNEIVADQENQCQVGASKKRDKDLGGNGHTCQLPRKGKERKRHRGALTPLPEMSLYGCKDIFSEDFPSSAPQHSHGAIFATKFCTVVQTLGALIT